MLTGRKIVITGGSIGIGLAIAEECARLGGTVLVAARNERDLSAALETLRSISNSPHEVFSLDVGDHSAVERFASHLRSEVGEIDGIVNCAGIYGPIGKSTEVPFEEFARTLQINFLGAVSVTAALTPLLSRRARGKIVNVAGGGAASAFPLYSAYACSKAALVRFTENLALELADEQIDVNCLAPGFVITRLHEQTLVAGARAGESFLKMTKDQIAKGGVPPEKAAKLTAFLLSAESDGISGKFISAPWDEWQSSSFQEQLRNDKDFAVLRRIDNFQFMKKQDK